MALLKLTVSNLTTRKMRVLLTVAAIAFSVSLVVAVTTGYRSVESAAFKFLNTFLGSTDATVTEKGMRGPARVPEGLIEEIRKDSDVRSVVGRVGTEVNFVPNRRAEIKGIFRPDDREVEKMALEAGQWFETSDGDVAVVDQVAADILKVKVGDTFAIPGVDKKLPLKVVGIIHKPAFLAQNMQTVYVPIHTLQRFLFPGEKGMVSRILISFKPGTDGEAFAARWKTKLQATDQGLQVTLSKDRKQDMARKLEGLSALSVMGGAVSMIAATFIVFSTLSMGVTERQRMLGMLRAIGAYRSQLAWLVVGEGLLLALIGVGVGVPLGLGWVKLLAWKYHFLFAAGVTPDLRGIVIGAGGSMAAALVASALPAWQAGRTSALSAMTPLAGSDVGGWPWRATIAGLVLVGIDPAILLGPLDWIVQLGGGDPLSVGVRSFKFYGHFFVGLGSMMAGFFLLAPIFVRVLDLVLSPVLAGMLGLKVGLVRQQLAGGMWRAAGTCASLMVGLAVLVVMQVQGHSMLEGWQLPTRFPDIFIVSPLKPLGDEEFAKLAKVKGIKPGEVMPLAVASPELGTGFFALAGAALVPDATMFFGVDPEVAFKLMELDFREGNAKDAEAQLKLGRHLIVTEEFRQLKGLHLGDKVALKTPKGMVDYTIAGVVWSPGIDVIVGLYDLDKQMDQRTAASVFGTLKDAHDDFGSQGAQFFVANVDVGTQKEELIKKVKESIGAWGMSAFDVRQIKYEIMRGFANLLTLVSVVPLAALAVASLGVTNTILASIRTRSWQFGILRSIGVTRSQLLRLVAAEALLLGLVGVTLGLVNGFVMVLDAKGLYRATLGIDPPTRVPWGMIGIGIGAVMAVAILASVVPAVGVSRRSPLSLLQSGRASA